jgi:DNA-binding Lrp family transcriptional regulator
MDDFDLRLLNALQEDGRLTNLELAERIGLSASQCSRRTALEQSGVIEGYHAALANQAVGLDVLVFIQVGLATQSPIVRKPCKADPRPGGGSGGLFVDR